MKRFKEIAAALGLTTVAALALTACGDDASAGGKDVAVTLTDAGCTPDQIDVAAGPVTFQVINGGTSAVTEMELKDQGGVILGEAENVVAGVPGKFSLNLQPGDYVVNCPNGSSEDQGTLTVTGEATSAPKGASAALLKKATSGYKAYVEDELETLDTDVDAFVAALASGDLQKAKDLYGPSRYHYETVEPVAESFGNLDPRIDARINDVKSPSDFTGFHRIEKTLWQDGTTKGTEPYAKQLQKDVETLQRKAKGIELQPAQLANGAVELLNEVSTSKITGEEDRYSHTDLSDFAGNLEGSEKAFLLLAPALDETGNEDLVKTIKAKFASVHKTLQIYENDTPLGYALYGGLTEKDKQRLAGEVGSLAESMSTVAAKVSGAG